MQLVAIQGIKGCFHEMAARKHFGNDIVPVECLTFRSLCQTLSRKEADYAVMAIENTLAGSILPNYGLIQKYGFSVAGEVYLHIKMNLAALPGVGLEGIKEVISHPVALAQCEDYLEEHPELGLIEFHDTAAAAKHINELQLINSAAICNELSVELYGLEILASGIETHKQNFTRFLVLSNAAVHIDGANKASLTLHVSHTPGSLADVLVVFKENRVNLTKIQSIPIIGKPYQYAFKVDLVWEDHQDYISSLERIRSMGNEIHVMGEYRSSSFGN